MRITRDLLHKFAWQTVTARLRSEPDIHAAYLVGSLVEEDPLLGGTTDIDLVLVHKYQASTKRECAAITPDISLDIYHKVREAYTDHRAFRQDPLMGYPLTHYNIILHDNEHWLEFIQSSVNAEFHRSDNVLARVRKFSTAARENWFSLLQAPPESHEVWMAHCLDILSLGANSVAGLIGPPLTTRRFLMTLKDRVETLGVPKVLAGFYGLLGYNEEQNENLKDWAKAFEEDLSYISKKADVPVHLKPSRHSYYVSGIQALLDSDSPGQALWPLLRTWLDIQLALGGDTPNKETWEKCLEALELTQDRAAEKCAALDAYLDSLEIVIESWENAYGI